MKKAVALSLLSLSAFLISSTAFAATPTLSVSGSGDAVQLRVSGDPMTTVTFVYTDSSGLQHSLWLGSSDSDGFFSSVISSSQYGIQSGSPVYVISGNVTTGAHSGSVTWPTPAVSQIGLGQSSVSIGVGQALVIPINNYTSGSLAIGSNSNSSVASAGVNGTILTVTGQALGSTVVTVCVNGTTGNCASVTVTVANTSSQSFNFSPANPVLLVGQSSNVTITGVISAGFYVSSNSNPSIVQANITSNLITLYGNLLGSSTLTICQLQQGGCAQLPVSVIATNSTGTNTGATAVSQASVTVAVGGSATVLAAGGSGGYSVSSNNTNIATVTLVNGTNLVIVGVVPGTATVSACDTNNLCAYTSVVVTPAPVQAPTTTTTSTAPTSVYQFTTYLSPGSQGLDVTALQEVLAALGNFSGTATGYYGTATENAVIAFQAAHGLSQLGVVGPATRAALNSLASGGTTTSTGTTQAGDGYAFSNFLDLASTGTDVTELQKRLTALGIYTGPVTGYFGALTAAAVKSFQTAHGIQAVGYVGPATRAALNGN